MAVTSSPGCSEFLLKGTVTEFSARMSGYSKGSTRMSVATFPWKVRCLPRTSGIEGMSQ